MRTPKRQVKVGMDEIQKRITQFHNTVRAKTRLFGEFAFIANVDESPLSFSGGPLEKVSKSDKQSPYFFGFPQVVCEVTERDCIVRSDANNQKRNCTLPFLFVGCDRRRQVAGIPRRFQ